MFNFIPHFSEISHHIRFGWIGETDMHTLAFPQPNRTVFGSIITIGDHKVEIHIPEFIGMFGFSCMLDADLC